MKKLILKAAKLFFNANTVLPIIQDTAFYKDYLEWTDLEVSLKVPFKTGLTVAVNTKVFLTALEALPDPTYSMDKSLKVSISSGKQKISIQGDDTNNFPMLPTGKERPVGDIPENLIHVLKQSLLFVSNDDLRPAMTVTQVHTHVAATDAHRLMFVPLETPFKEEVLIERKVIALLEIFGGDWQVSAFDKNEMAYITFKNSDGVEIIQRKMDCRYPDWKVVVPQFNDKSAFVMIDKKEMLAAIKIGSKFWNRSTNQIVLDLKKNAPTMFKAADIDFSLEYNTELGIKGSHDLSIAFNGKFVNEIVSLFGDTVKMNYSGPTKSVVFDGKILLMPLMLNS
jgi:DNA polymerase III sliding clamp (beta) subunit (PCNA family)